MHILQFTTEGESIYKDTQNARNTQITLCRWKESGTCPSGTDEPPGKATFIATLRCKTVSEQVCHRLADALPAIKGKAVTVSSQLLRSLRLLHNCQLTVLVYPPPPPGAINARETPYRCDRQCLESAYINIIPSGLCNSSLDRHLSARTTSICEGQWPATSVLQAAG